ncbi:PAS domain S-box protein, partial [Candidatus Dojkabacteria bacterium]|nr:PAS domain S-box protein [Candidatus Dojkabacteria bacterium]
QDDREARSLIAISAPLKDNVSRDDIGVLTVFFDTEKLTNLVKGLQENTQLGEELERNLFIVGKAGVVAIAADPGIIGNTVLNPSYQLCDASLVDTIEYRNVAGEDVSGAYDCISEAGMMVVSEYRLSFPHGTDVDKLILIAACVLALVVGGASYFLYVRFSYISPIIKIGKFADKIAQKDFSAKLNIHGGSEAGHLAQSMKNMVSSLREAYQNLQSEIDLKTAELKQSLEKLKTSNKSMRDSQKALINVFEDIDEEKKKAVSLSADLKKFQLAVDRSFDAIVITDPHAVIQYANPAIEYTTGYKREEIIGKNPGDLWGGHMDGDFYNNLWTTIAKDKKPFRQDIKNNRKNGEEFISDLYIAPLLNDEGETIFYISVQRDVTQAKAVDRMKTEFISLASHQLRTPLTAIKWYLELMADTKLEGEQLKYFENVRLSSERMINLVDSLLNVSRIESGRIAVSPKPTFLTKLMDESIAELQGQIQERKINVSQEYAPGLPEVNIDPQLIREVYQNLLSNAVKYAFESTTVHVNIHMEGESVITKIRNTGIGIPANSQKQMFSKFFRAGNAQKQDTNGNGLGMYLVKQIVEVSGGEISFTSEENKDTEFIVKLPLAGSQAKSGDVGLS